MPFVPDIGHFVPDAPSSAAGEVPQDDLPPKWQQAPIVPQWQLAPVVGSADLPDDSSFAGAKSTDDRDATLAGWLANLPEWKRAAARVGAEIAKGPAFIADLADKGSFPRVIEAAYDKVRGKPIPKGLDLTSKVQHFEDTQGAWPNEPWYGKVTDFAAGLIPVGGAIGKGGRLISKALEGAERDGGKVAEEALEGLRGRERSLAGGKSIGMRATPGQARGSVPLQQAEEWARSQPWLSGPFAKLARRNQDVLNRTAAAELGEPGERVLDEQTLGRVADRLSEIFEKAHDPNAELPVNPKETRQFLDDLDERYEGLLKDDKRVSSNPLVRRLKRTLKPSDSTALVKAGESSKATYTVTAQKLGKLSSKLGKRAFKEMSSAEGDRDLGQALYEVKDHVDNLLERNMTPEGRAKLTAARKHYRRLMQFLRRGVVNPSTGDVSGKTLAGELARSDRSGFTFGKNDSDLYRAARFSQAFKPIVGDSGTATRMSNPLLDIPMSALGHLASSAYLNAPRILSNPFVQSAGLQGFGDLEPYLQSDDQP